MSQIQETKRLDLQYTVTASYFVPSFNKDGHMIEEEKKNQNIALWRLQRRNIEHSKLSMSILSREESKQKGVIGLAMDFIKACCVDDKVREDLLGDALACVEIFQSEPVSEDFRRFFGTWEFLKALPKNPSGKK